MIVDNFFWYIFANFRLEPVGKTITNHGTVFHQIFLIFILIAVAAFAASFARSQVVDFAHPLWRADHKFLIKNPIGDFNYLAYVQPFNSLAWLFVGLFLILTPPILFLSNL